MKSPDSTTKQQNYVINPNVSVNLKRKFSEMNSKYEQKSKTGKSSNNMSILNFVHKKFKN